MTDHAGHVAKFHALRKQYKGLNKTEKTQTARIAKKVVKTMSETKHRAWYYPSTTYRNLEHNKPFFLFGGVQNAGLLNLASVDNATTDSPSSRPRPEGDGLPQTKPGNCREGVSIRLLSLEHYFTLSGYGANKNTMLRIIMFSYPTGNDRNVVEGDILLQPEGVGATIGFANIFLRKNIFNGVGVKFLMDKTYQLNGTSAGASNDGTIDVVNWGYSGVKTFKFNKYFKGQRINYGLDTNGQISDIPALRNIGIMIVPYGANDSLQDEQCGQIDLWGDMLFKDI